MAHHRKRHAGDFSKFLVALSFFLLITYTVVILIIFARTGLEPETMTKYFVGAIVGEFGFLSGIRVVKEISVWKNKKEGINDEPNNTSVT